MKALPNLGGDLPNTLPTAKVNEILEVRHSSCMLRLLSFEKDWFLIFLIFWMFAVCYYVRYIVNLQS